MQISERESEIFWSSVKRDQKTGCLLWLKSTDLKGYGHMKIGGTLQMTHRVAWFLAGNKLTSRKPNVLHDCPHGDNPLCCEVAHLWAGNDLDNMQDRARKGRTHKSRLGFPFGAHPQRSGRFQSHVGIVGKHVGFGTYGTAEEASAISVMVREEIHRMKHSDLRKHHLIVQKMIARRLGISVDAKRRTRA